MKYNNFKEKAQERPIIYSRDLTRHQADKQAIRNQLRRWHKKRLLIKLKRGIFILNAGDRKINPSKMYIANQLVSPSYVSMEYSLSFYGLIPESVSDVTNITTKKTRLFKNEVGNFIYQHVSPAAFRGFKSIKDEAGLDVFIAEPEKALIDTCYLNLKIFKKDYEGVFLENYRLQNMETLDPDRIIKFAHFFNNKKLMRVSRSLAAIIRKEKRRR